MSSNSDKALDVIGNKLKIKEEIDAPFDENALKNENNTIGPAQQDPNTARIYYVLPNKDIGFNVICQLNLGMAYEMVENVRRKYPANKKDAMNEVWLDYCIDAIKNATNPIVVLTDIFTRVTTGNYKTVLPYKEQLSYIYNKLKDPKIKNKIVILARGTTEQSIINNGGPDLMKKLGNMLDMPDRVTNGGTLLTLEINSPRKENKPKLTFLHVDQKTNSRNTLAKTMRNFAETHPGYDIYYSTNSKQNWCGAGMTTYVDKDGKTKAKTCWFISFGGFCEYDKFNLKRPALGPYALNKNWYKVFVDEKDNVKINYVNYIFQKKEYTNYVSTVVATKMNESYQDLIKTIDQNISSVVDKGTKKVRTQLTKTINSAKTKVKKEFEKTCEEIEKTKLKDKTTPADKEKETEKTTDTVKTTEEDKLNETKKTTSPKTSTKKGDDELCNQ